MTRSNEKIIIIRKRKYNFGADPEMGYCPMSIRLGAQAALRWTGRRRALGAWLGAGLGAGGRWAGQHGCWAAGGRGRRARQGRATGRRSGLVAQARGERGTGAVRATMRGLGMLLGRGLCTWCTRPVFGPV